MNVGSRLTSAVAVVVSLTACAHEPVTRSVRAPESLQVPTDEILTLSARGSGVQSIQRLHTVGGRAPPTGCGQNYAGTESRVAYTADYYFYSGRR